MTLDHGERQAPPLSAVNDSQDYFDGGDAASALAVLEQALRIHPGQPDLVNKLAEYLFQLGEAAEAKRLLLGVVREHPHYAKAYNNLGVLYWDQGERQKAYYYITRGFELTPTDRMLVMNLADMALACGRDDDASFAMRHYLQRIGMDPEIEELLRGLTQQTSPLGS